MIRKYLLLILFICLGFTKSYSQLGIRNLTASRDTVQFNDTVTFNFNLQNFGANSFNGQVIFYYSVNNIFQGVLDSNQYNVSPGTTTQVVIPNHIVLNVPYTTGDNVVVIWPVSNVPTADSASVHLIVDLTGINKIDKNNFSVFYNSATQEILLKSKEKLTDIKFIAIIDILGHHFQMNNKSDEALSVKGFPVGLYFLEIENEGRRYGFKFIILKE